MSALFRWMIRFSLCLVVLLLGGCVQVWFPGTNYRQALPTITEKQKDLSNRLRAHVTTLSQWIGERNIPDHARQLQQASEYIQQALRGYGYAPLTHPFDVGDQRVENISAQIDGSTHADQIVVVAAHYDSARGSPGANDNGTGVAGTLELARELKDAHPSRTIRFVFFVNEEPPYFQTKSMGSLVYARECAAKKEDIVAMFTLETIGCYSDQKNSQHYPGPFGMIYPSQGNFIFIIGDFGSRRLTSEIIQSFRRHTKFPSEGAAVPGSIEGVGWSDHWSFWQAGYKGVMVTDTAPFRYPHYHTKNDLPDKIDFDRTARVVEGFVGVTRDLAMISAR